MNRPFRSKSGRKEYYRKKAAVIAAFKSRVGGPRVTRSVRFTGLNTEFTKWYKCPGAGSTISVGVGQTFSKATILILPTLKTFYDGNLVQFQKFRVLAAKVTFRPVSRNFTISTQIGFTEFYYVDPSAKWSAVTGAYTTFLEYSRSPLTSLKGCNYQNYGNPVSRYLKAPADKMGWIDPQNWGSNLDNATDIFEPGFEWGQNWDAAITGSNYDSKYMVEVDICVQHKGFAQY